jgi:hypothetical protein
LFRIKKILFLFPDMIIIFNITKRNIRQIISGAGSKGRSATIGSKTDFSYGGSGFAVLNIRKDESSDIEYFSTKNNTLKKLTQFRLLKNLKNLSIITQILFLLRLLPPSILKN